MEITLEKKDSTNATIKVNLTASDYQPKVVEKVKEYSKKAQLKGFRPGKVPTALIEKMYGKSILVDEINHLLTNSLNSYIKENNLPIIGDPLPDTQKTDGIEWENQKDFVFNYNIGLVPDFQYELSDKLNVTEYEIEVSEGVVNETLINLQKQFGKITNPETSAEGDTIYGELQEADGTVKTVSLDLSKANKNQTAGFIGKSKGDTITFNIGNIFEDKAVLAHAMGISMEEARKKEGEATIVLINVNRSENAEVNQEFFDKIFGKDVVTTEADFFAKLKETIKENYVRESEYLLKRDIQEALVNTTSMELPNEFLKRWLLVSNQGKITQQQIDNEYEYYLKELKWTLIKNRLAKDNDIKIENEAILEKAKGLIRQQFGGMDFGPEMEETFNNIADNYLKQEKGKNYLKLYDEVLLEKILALVKDKVNIAKKKISVEEFKNLA